MSGESGKEKETPVTDLVDYVFPFDHLLAWSKAVDMSVRSSPVVMENLRKITMHPDFRMISWGIDVVVFSPSKKTPIEIQHGSGFDLADFRCLEDEQLNMALKSVKDLSNDVARGTFTEVMTIASILMAGEPPFLMA